MKRIIFLDIEDGKYLEESLSSSLKKIGGNFIFKKKIDVLSKVNINLLKKTVSELNFKSDDFIDHLIRILKNHKIEISVFEHKKTVEEAISKKILNIIYSGHISNFKKGKKLLYTKSENEAILVGGAFLWKDILKEDIFYTENKKIFDYDYLPVQLAKDGKGIFFEERIIDRLKQIKFLNDFELIDKIYDKGGWEDLSNLTAKLDIKIKGSKKEIKKTLLVTALVPAPPVKPEKLSKAIENRRLIMNLINIPTSVIFADDGLIYEIFLPYTLRKYLVEINDKLDNEKVITQTSRIAALLDFGILDYAKTVLDIENYQDISDFIEISSIEDVALLDNINFLDVLRTDGDIVYWSELKRDIRIFKTLSPSGNLDILLKVCPKKYQNFAIKWYNKYRNEFNNEVKTLH